jgi:Ca2+-transporting ATPase
MTRFAHGLTSGEVATLLRRHGPNELPQPAQRNIFRIIFEVIQQPMFAMLLAAGIIYAFLGEPLDATVLMLFALLSVSITIVQESRSERVLESLRTLANPRALVVRDGAQIRIPGRDVVPGDLMILSEGDRIPADATLETCQDLVADESILTGESMSVRKRPGQAEGPQAPGGEDLPSVFAGTLVVRGSGEARVTTTGVHTELGKIGTSLQAVALEQPRLQKQLRWLVRDFAIFGFVVAGAVILLLGIRNGAWLQAALAGIAVGMSALPEEFPLVLAVFMAMGARRISRAGVLTRRATAIETLGSATVLCSDKTGTMTENVMQLQALVCEGHAWRDGAGAVPSPLLQLLSAAYGASAMRPTDPMDRAIHKAITQVASGNAKDFIRLVRTYGLRPDLFAMTNVWAQQDGEPHRVFTKGAPETIVGLCGLAAEPRAFVLAQIDELAKDGIRVLAVAESIFDPASGELPDKQEGFTYNFLGLIGFADPLRTNVKEAVGQCQAAGVRVLMITGDHPLTAQSIARQAGLDDRVVMTGDQLAALSDAELIASVKTVSVFSRIRPAQKLRIVEALKANGEIVAMTGDGVNDAPAIKAAHIGIAMGKRGTDVAREAASLVLLNDDFVSIVSTIRLGRRIYDNLQKAIQYIIAVHIPIAGLAILPLLLGMPVILAPIQIAFLEMVIDPACSIVFESEPDEAEIMRRTPRDPKSPIVPWPIAIWALVQGMTALLLVGFTLILGAHLGLAEPDLRALTFTVLVAMNLGLILVNRSFDSSLRVAITRPNRSLWGLVGGVVVVLSCALYFGPARALFHFGLLHGDDLLAALALGVLLIVSLEVGKTALPKLSRRFFDKTTTVGRA